MSVVVKNMKMPNKCSECIGFFDGMSFGRPYCYFADKNDVKEEESYLDCFKDIRPEWCPLESADDYVKKEKE